MIGMQKKIKLQSQNVALGTKQGRSLQKISEVFVKNTTGSLSYLI